MVQQALTCSIHANLTVVIIRISTSLPAAYVAALFGYNTSQYPKHPEGNR